MFIIINADVLEGKSDKTVSFAYKKETSCLKKKLKNSK
jgi:hypothetical protein